MPMMPLGRKTSSAESRLAPGALVDYEQHGKPILGVVLRERKSNWVVLNPDGKEVELGGIRLYLYPGNEFQGELSKSGVKELTAFLGTVNDKVDRLLLSLNLEELWDVVRDEVREYSASELAELAFADSEHLLDSNGSSIGHLAMRRGLISDTVFFKRKKIGFEPRSPEVVEDLKHQVTVERRKAEGRKSLADAIWKALRGEKVEFPPSIELIEDIAVNGGKSPRFKEASLLLGEITDAILSSSAVSGGRDSGLSLRGKTEERAFELLVRIGIFKPDEHLALRRAGVRKAFPDEIEEDAQHISGLNLDDPTCPVLENRQDLTSLFAVSVDAEDTTDIDDALSVTSTPEGYQVGIHISDVASLIAQGCAIDHEARHRATSLYFPDAKVPMLPAVLSEGVASLWAGRKRLALSFLIHVSRDGLILSRTIVPSVIRVAKKLSYDFVDQLLENGGGDDHEQRMIAAVLSDLWSVASVLEQGRLARGAVFISRREVFPVVDEAGRVRLDEWQEDTPARKLVSELMVLANETGAIFARDRAIPLVFRSQESPDDNTYEEASERDSAAAAAKETSTSDAPPRVMLKPSTVSSNPGLHSGLALTAYAQMTSPIRRYYDLVNQRQILSALGFPQQMRSKEEIDDLIMHEENTLGEARILQKERTRYWMFKYLYQERIKDLTGTILRVDGPKPLAEIDLLGMNLLFRSHRHRMGNTMLRVGERVQLSVERVEPRNDDIVLVERGR